MTADFLDGFLDDYFAECDEHLTAVRRGLLALEASVGLTRPDAVVTESLFRSFHSIKGISGMVEHRESELLAHEMEAYLRAVREGEVRLTTRGVEVLIEGTRALEHSIAQWREQQPVPDITPVVASVRSLLAAADAVPGVVAQIAPQSQELATWKCVFAPSPALIARGINVDLVRSRLREVGEIVQAMPRVTGGGSIAFEFLFKGSPDPAALDAWRADGMVCTPQEVSVEAGVASPVAAADAVAEVGPGPSTLSSGQYVRVDLARLDGLMRMIGDMVIMRSRLGEALARVESHVSPQIWRGVQEASAGIERQLRELREGVMRVRLVPVGEIFRRMPFVARDLARETGRKMRVELKGQDTEIDKFLVERMMDPVLHLVRNAASHGLESVEERIAAGKPPEGRLTLSASTAGEMVTIEIADDGRGVDVERVLARARRAGLPVPSGTIDDSTLLDLISSPGFSTRDEADRVSGRGFGMSVVRSMVQELGGSIRMISEPGRGTRFVIELPLTLAITDALIARIGTHSFAVPQAVVREVVELEADAVRVLQGSEVVSYRGDALPVVRLSSVLGIPSDGGPRLHAFVVGAGTSAVGMVVDRIVGQREIVVRSTIDPLIRVEGLGGATDLGDGRVVLILDLSAIARRARDRGRGGVRDDGGVRVKESA